ncbi:alkyl hydroperoxide reductase [Chryseobacterium sp. Leaf180]|jgi:thiol-disulfide isomerase/thioredoxin|uniref:TlpA family protein disulfide reductase n=1 Tax=Chryseobacterium sp. Leaf180 TaxID=1736289 RepID=UPI0006F992EA|nr:thioredoxin family protein [Chryseobacterium sp. Leaf180]KQR93679.1 alkyl hydroperoxide reductase [Chryseobacterium sp. Leaf180]
MKNIFTVLLLAVFTLGCSQKKPAVDKKAFTQSALSQKLQDKDGKSITVKEILAAHKGKTVVLDFWAGWCKDCLKALPKAKELEANNPDVDFVYLSLERSPEGFEKSLARWEMKEKENYWFSTGWKNDFNNYIELNWIPRYMVISPDSQIALYYSISPEDPEIQKTIDLLK